MFISLFLSISWVYICVSVSVCLYTHGWLRTFQFLCSMKLNLTSNITLQYSSQGLQNFLLPSPLYDSLPCLLLPYLLPSPLYPSLSLHSLKHPSPSLPSLSLHSLKHLSHSVPYLLHLSFYLPSACFNLPYLPLHTYPSLPSLCIPSS